MQATDVVHNRETNTFIMCFNDKSFIIQDVESFELPTKLIVKDASKPRLGNPTCLGRSFVAIVDKNVVVEIDSQKLVAFGRELEIEHAKGGDVDTEATGVKVHKFDRKGLHLKNDYISWVVSSDFQNAVVAGHESVEHLKNINSDDFKYTDQTMFGLTCCGASISKSQKYALIGDFLGTARLFNNAMED